MIRPATQLLKEHGRSTAVVVAGLALVMILPSILLFSLSTADRLAGRWFGSYRPVVYLTPDGGTEEAEELANSIRDWSGVSGTRVRSPSDAYRLTAERLGEGRLTEAGARPEMFPYSIVVTTEGAAPDPAVLSRLEALVSRSSVDSVDVPSQDVRDLLSALDSARMVGVVLVALIVVGGFVRCGQYLQRLRESERDTLRLLQRFGAPARTLRRATLIRGAVLGLWAGLAATAILLAIALYWRTIEASLLGGVPAATPRTWLVVAAPIVLGPVGGAGVGMWVARRPLGGDTRGHPDLHPLLDHE